MRKNFMKKAVAVTLSAAMAFSLSAVTNPTTASAATVGLNAKKKTITVGKKFTLKLNKAGQKNWKITKAVSAKPKVVKVNKKTKKNVVVKGLKKGKSKVTVTLKRKNGKAGTKKLTCTFTVKKKTPTDPTAPTTPTAPTDPTTPTTPVQTEDKATTQEELIAKLANKDLTKLTLETEAEKIDIPAGTYSNLTLVVNAPNAEVTNEAVFKDIEIQAIKADTWFEKAASALGSNKIVIKAPKARLVIDAIAKLAKLKLDQNGAAADKVMKLEVQGSLDNVEVNASTNLNVDVQGTGEVSQMDVLAGSDIKINGGATAKAIKVNVAATAAATNLTSDVKTELTLSAVVNVTFTAGAAGSSVKANKEVEGKELVIKNQTGANIDLISSNGSKTPIANNNGDGKVTPPVIQDTTNPTTPSKPNFDQNGSDNNDNTTSESVTITVDGVKAKGHLTGSATKEADVPTGSALDDTNKDSFPYTYTVSGGALGELTLSGIKPNVTSGCVMKIDVAYTIANKTYQKSVLTNGGSPTCITGTSSEDVEKLIDKMESGTIGDITIALTDPISGSFVGKRKEADLKVSVSVQCTVVKVGKKVVKSSSRNDVFIKGNQTITLDSGDATTGTTSIDTNLSIDLKK